MVAIDTSATAQKALDESIRLAGALGACLCIAYAADEAALTQHGMGLGTYIDIEKVKGEIRDAGNRLLDTAMDKAAAAGCKAERILVEAADKRIAEMIIDAAHTWRADLIVVGTHGRRGFERLLVGSVAENLVRIATTSLLLVREH
jgi:nucleotide-binding universal stress UspA family protein